MTTAIDHISAFVLEHPWATTRGFLATIVGILADRRAGHAPDPELLAALAQQRKALPQPRRGGGVAVIPIYGGLAPRLNLLSEMSGGATFDQLERQVREAVADPQVKTLVFDVNSPGGNVAGATEFHRVLLKARAAKPAIAIANHLCASAAYWAMSAATRVVASPSALIGSVGVMTIYDDLSAAFEQRGIKRDVIAAGKFKGEAIGGPLSAEARGRIQALVDDAYARMTGDIAKGRGITPAAARAYTGDCITAEAALEAGMIDEIATLEETLARLGVTTDTVPLTAATAQEPLAATAQELAADALWCNAALAECATLDLYPS